MKNILLVTVCGLPGCGKSYLCHTLSVETSTELSYVWVEYDKLIRVKPFIGIEEKNHTDWKKWRQAIVECTEKLIICWKNEYIPLTLSAEAQELWQHLEPQSSIKSANIVVLLDDNFYYGSMRRLFFALAKQYCLSYASIVCLCSLDRCIERDKSRDNSVQEAILRSMNDKFEWPNYAVHSWEKYVFCVDMNVDDFRAAKVEHLANLRRFLLSVDPLCSNTCTGYSLQSNIDRVTNLNNVVHNVDKFLRAKVNELISSRDSTWRILYAKKVTEIKCKTLHTIREYYWSDEAKCDIDVYKEYAHYLFKLAVTETLAL